MKQEFVCICCPRGCMLTAEVEDGKVLSVSGNSCKRGKDYAETEATAPVRMVTTTVRTPEGYSIPVKTQSPIPKGKIFDCMREIKALTVHTPLHMGDVILEDAAGTGVAIVVCRTVGLPLTST